jgi:hypothetical protein
MRPERHEWWKQQEFCTVTEMRWNVSMIRYIRPAKIHIIYEPLPKIWSQKKKTIYFK